MELILKERFNQIETGVVLGYVVDNKPVNVIRVYPGVVVEVTDKEGELILDQMDCVENVKAPEAGDPIDTMTVKELNQIFKEKGLDIPDPSVKAAERRALLKESMK